MRVVKMILEQNHVDPDTVDGESLIPFILAADNWHERVVEILLR